MCTKMKAIGAYLFCGLALLTTTALPVQKEVISTRLVTRWEIEFVSLNLAAAASEFPCQAKDILPDLPSLFLVTRYEIPKRREGIMRLGVKQPKLDCESGLISLGDGDSRSLMTILAVSDQTCLSETDLRLYINIGAKDESTSSAFFHTAVYPEQTTIEWKEKFLLDDTGNSILRIKWRVSCQQHIPENHQRLKRQIPDGTANGTDDGEISSINNGTPKPSMGNTDTPNVTSSASTASSALENGTESVANNSQTGQDTDAGGSGEPPDSFNTGISETFAFTKTSEPSKVITNSLNEVETSSNAVVVQNLNMLDFGNSTSSTSSVYESTFTPVIPNSGDQSEDNLIKQTSPDINAAATGDGETADNSTKHSDVKATTTNKPKSGPRPGDREDQRTTTTTTTQSTTSVKPSRSSTTAKSLPDTIPADREDNETTTTTTTTTTQSTPSIKSSTTAKILHRTRPVDIQDPKTTKTTTPTSTSKQPNNVANGDDSTATTTKLNVKPSTSVPTTSPRLPLSTTTTTAAIIPGTPKPSPTTKQPPRPGDRNLETTTTTTTSRPIRPIDQTPASTTPSTTKKDVIFTAPKPSPTYPDTSNEPYIGKTGETSSAGWVDKDPNQIADDGADEATIWPIVMGLVVGIPTIIVIAIAITVFQKKLPQRTMSPSGGYFERRPPQMPFVIVSKHDVSSTAI